MKIPNFLTHYYEDDHGPFLNICDMEEEALQKLIDSEKHANTAFNRFAMGSRFIDWRRSADDLLIRAYTEKFGFAPDARPYFATLGAFDRTLTMFRSGKKLTLNISDFDEHELTFMYPDHSHLTTVYGADVPHLFYQPPEDWRDKPVWGRLFTFRELVTEYAPLGIAQSVQSHLDRDGWAGCYVEAHIWCRDKRTKKREQGVAPQSATRSEFDFPT